MKAGIDYIGIVIVFICHDGQGHFLMSRRSHNARDEHGRWEFNGGQLDWGEKVENVLRRELKEELNLVPKRVDFIASRDVHRVHSGKRDHWITLDYLVLVDPKKARINEPEKFDEIGWFPLNNLPKNLHSQTKTTLKGIKSYLRREKRGI